VWLPACGCLRPATWIEERLIANACTFHRALAIRFSSIHAARSAGHTWRVLQPPRISAFLCGLCV